MVLDNGHHSANAQKHVVLDKKNEQELAQTLHLLTVVKIVKDLLRELLIVESENVQVCKS